MEKASINISVDICGDRTFKLAQQIFNRMIAEFYGKPIVSFAKKPLPNSFAKCLCHYAFPPAMSKISDFSTSNGYFLVFEF